MVRRYRLQRALDWAVLVVAAVPVLVVGAICAAAVKVTSRGPVLFRQERAGLDGQPFEALKFRSMLVGDNPWVPADDRITSAGRWLRRTSLDELPQLLNVVRGEMSIVGPRPMLPAQAAVADDRQRLRLAVRPGMTGLAQVRGRNGISWPERIEHDLEYVQTRSLWQDVRILAGSLAVVFGGEGVEGHDADDPFVRVLVEGPPAPRE